MILGLRHINDNILQSIAASCLEQGIVNQRPTPLTSRPTPESVQPTSPVSPPSEITNSNYQIKNKIGNDNREQFQLIPNHMDKNFNVYIEQNIRTVRVKEGEDLSLKCSANSSVSDENPILIGIMI